LLFTPTYNTDDGWLVGGEIRMEEEKAPCEKRRQKD